MLAVMAITLAMFLICSAVLVMGTNAAKIAVFEVNQDKAYYTAEAGIEKVLAEAKNSPDWLKNLNVGREYDFLLHSLGGENDYGEGTFEYIRVKKLAEDERRTSLEIECRGVCGSSIKRVRVNADLETVYPADLFRGFWVGDGGASGGHVFDLAADAYFSGGDAVIGSGSHIAGNIYSRGMVIFQCEGDGSGIDGDIYTLEGVDCAGSGPLSIGGFIYVDDINKSPDELKEITVEMPAGELAAKIPDAAGFPDLLSADRLAWYQKNAGYSQLPPADDGTMVFQNGIYFLSGGCELSGTYSGNALLVVDGSLELGSLTKSGDGDSLAILASGPVSSGPEGGEIDALLYSAGQVDFDGGAAVRGSMLAGSPASGQGSPVSVSYDEDMLDAFSNACSWTICFVRVTRWDG